MGAKQPKRKEGWGRDHGNVHGHPTKHPGLHQPGTPHTEFEARGFHADKGHNTHPERISVAPQNRHRAMRGEDRDQINVHGGHDPRPEHYHKNSGTSPEGHALMRRGRSRVER